MDEVKIHWEKNWLNNPTRYNEIWIRQPILGGNDIRIYNQNHDNWDTIETLTPYTISANRSFRILLYFNASIRDRHIIFTLNPDDPNAENYRVEFYTPN